MLCLQVLRAGVRFQGGKKRKGMPWKLKPNSATQQQLLEDPRGETLFLADPGTPCSFLAPEQLQKSDLLGEKLITVS